MNSPRSNRALSGDDDFGAAFEVGIVLLVNLFAEDEHDHVGILLDRAGLAQIGELRPVVAAPAFGSAAELQQSNNGDTELFGDGFQSARNRRNFLGAILEALTACRHELQVIDHQQV